MEKTSQVTFEQVASTLSRAYLLPEFGAIAGGLAERGYVDGDGVVAFVPVSPGELVYDLARRASDAGERVVFVTYWPGLLRRCTCSRIAGSSAGPVTNIKIGTTVLEWFEMLDSSGVNSTRIAEHVPNAVPESLVSPEPLAAAVEVSSRI